MSRRQTERGSRFQVEIEDGVRLAAVYFRDNDVEASVNTAVRLWWASRLRGRRFWQLDSTLVKYFKVTERVRFELRMEFYNLPNAFMPSDPDVGIASGTMGRSTWVAGGNYGREIQYTGRIHF